MIHLFKAAGFSEQEARELIQHLFKSGSLNAEFINNVLNLIESKETTVLPIPQRIILAGAAEQAKKTDGNLDIDDFLSKIVNIPDRYLLALIQAGHQRYFSDQTVVALQQPTKYSEENKDAILALAATMKMVEEERINHEEGEVKVQVDIGVCIGATSKTIQGYLENQQRIQKNRPSPEVPYQLYILLSKRNLSDTASDNPTKSDESFKYSADEGVDYKQYLADKYKVSKADVTESHAMRDRFEVLYGKTIEQAEKDGWLHPMKSANAEAFINTVATEISNNNKGDNQIIALTNVQPFNRTYRTMMENSLSAQENKDKFIILSDGGRGAASQQPQTIMREFAKIINSGYSKIAKECKIENPVDASIISGSVIKTMEEKALAAKQETLKQ